MIVQTLRQNAVIFYFSLESKKLEDMGRYVCPAVELYRLDVSVSVKHVSFFTLLYDSYQQSSRKKLNSQGTQPLQEEDRSSSFCSLAVSSKQQEAHW